MTIELGGAQIFGVLLTLISTFGGLWLRRLNTDQAAAVARMDALQRELSALREQMAREANDYTRRAEMQELIQRIETKIDRLADKFYAQQDKA